MDQWYDYFEDIIPGKINTKELLRNASNLSLKDPKILTSVLKEYGKINYSGVLGKKLIDVDIDNENLYSLAEKHLPKTLSTKKGEIINHYFYLNDINIERNLNKLGIEIKVNGNVILPPSLVDDVERKWAYEIPPVSGKTVLYSIQKILFEYYFNLHYPHIGIRNNVINHVVGWLCYRHFSSEDILQILTDCGQVNKDDSREDIINNTIEKYFNGTHINYKGISEYYNEDIVNLFKKILDIEEEEKNNFLDWMNENFCYLEYYNEVWDIDNGLIQKNLNNLKKFRLSMFNKTIGEGDKKKIINVLDVWASSKNKFICKTIGFYPGKDKVVNGVLNVWKKTGCVAFNSLDKKLDWYFDISEFDMIEPKENDYLFPIFLLLKGFFTNNKVLDEISYRYFLNWLAYPLQKPGEKLDTTVVLYSEKQGVGKGSIAQVMSDIYGDSYIRILGNDLNKEFNDYLFKKQFVFVDEIRTNERANAIDYIKTLITEPSYNLNRKFQPVISLNNTMNFLLATNYDYALPLTTEDRRFFIVNITQKPSESFFINFHKWRQEKGSAAFYYHLLNNVDLSNFNPHQKAPSTLAKEEMIEVNKSDIECILDDMWWSLPDVLTTSYVINRIKLEHDGAMYLTASKVGRVLKNKGAIRRTMAFRGSTLSVWIKNEDFIFFKNEALIDILLKHKVIRGSVKKDEDIRL